MKAGWLLLVLAACDGSEAATDAALSDVDAPPIDDCAARLSGVLVNMSDIPIPGAKVTYDRDTSTVTDDAGGFTLCPGGEVTGTPTVLALDAPGDYLDGTIYFPQPTTYRATIRTMAAAEVSQLYMYDPSKAQVLVTQLGAEAQLTLHADYEVTKSAYDDMPWMDGNAGRYVLFGNVDVSAPTAQLDEKFSVSTVGMQSIDVAAGKVSLVVLELPIDP